MIGLRISRIVPQLLFGIASIRPAVALFFEGPEGGGLACFFAAVISAQSEGVDLANQGDATRIVLIGPAAGK